MASSHIGIPDLFSIDQRSPIRSAHLLNDVSFCRFISFIFPWWTHHTLRRGEGKQRRSTWDGFRYSRGSRLKGWVRGIWEVREASPASRQTSKREKGVSVRVWFLLDHPIYLSRRRFFPCLTLFHIPVDGKQTDQIPALPVFPTCVFKGKGGGGQIYLSFLALFSCFLCHVIISASDFLDGHLDSHPSRRTASIHIILILIPYYSYLLTSFFYLIFRLPLLSASPSSSSLLLHTYLPIIIITVIFSSPNVKLLVLDAPTYYFPR
ncbi:uncharacterized protein GGS22DRAFT_24415 [Annulohypoxylon maeteangense]|uniref:uncharacterized protein n=1 Tax=Annulohypoxylon maeteangense TaxID=1927788 RepID=UPI00200832F5|nr:uncharacterized protein GGS22DRAFT_24415 [Annulohypoxylon maeteangense]KAI0883686.1 hypothetical protein GGS22DRAFT_24415 [Annulohypoxylon maeteangense]